MNENSSERDDIEAFEIITGADLADFWDLAAVELRALWPEYNHHGDDSRWYFGGLHALHPGFQFLVRDPARDAVVARGRSIPFCWDGTLDDLPAGIDAVGMRAVYDTREPSALSALSIEVVPDHRGQGISGLLLIAMRDAARQAGLRSLLAPVRPSWKVRYPMVPIEEYATWTDSGGLPFDPWMRVHARLGAAVVRPEPRSMRITGTVEEWRAWTSSEFATDGPHLFPGGLAPLEVRDGVGRYWEPNVWMQHPV